MKEPYICTKRKGKRNKKESNTLKIKINPKLLLVLRIDRWFVHQRYVLAHHYTLHQSLSHRYPTLLAVTFSLVLAPFPCCVSLYCFPLYTVTDNITAEEMVSKRIGWGGWIHGGCHHPIPVSQMASRTSHRQVIGPCIRTYWNGNGAWITQATHSTFNMISRLPH